MLGAMQADTPWPGLMSALDEIASNKRVADELSKEERARADELCDQIKVMLTPSHVLSRNLRAAASSARTPVDRGAATLPAELFLADFRDSIFMHLRVGDLGSATAVCKAWSTDDAWRAAYARRWLYIGGDDDGDGIGFFKLSYALRDACESRDFDEAELIADAENKPRRRWLGVSLRHGAPRCGFGTLQLQQGGQRDEYLPVPLVGHRSGPRRLAERGLWCLAGVGQGNP